jgi:hypothetical protein
MTSSTTPTIPADEAKAADATITDAELAQAGTAHDRFKALLETKPRAKARHDAVLAEISSRQATLRRLREARALTQTTVGDLLDMDSPRSPASNAEATCSSPPSSASFRPLAARCTSSLATPTVALWSSS